MAYFTGARLVDITENDAEKSFSNLRRVHKKKFAWNFRPVPWRKMKKRDLSAKDLIVCPSFIKSPVRVAMLASIPALPIVMLAGGPVTAVGAVAALAGANYISKGVKATLNAPIIGTFMKRMAVQATYVGAVGAAVSGTAALALGAAPLSLVGVPAIALAGGLGSVVLGAGAAGVYTIKKLREKPENKIIDSGEPKDGMIRFGDFAKKILQM